MIRELPPLTHPVLERRFSCWCSYFHAPSPELRCILKIAVAIFPKNHSGAEQGCCRQCFCTYKNFSTLTLYSPSETFMLRMSSLLFKFNANMVLYFLLKNIVINDASRKLHGTSMSFSGASMEWVPRYKCKSGGGGC